MQDLPNPATVQFHPDVSSFANPFQASNSIGNTSDPTITSRYFPQSLGLQGRQNIPPSPLANEGGSHRECRFLQLNVSPSPSASHHFPIKGGFHPRSHFPWSVRTGLDPAGGPSLPPPAPPERPTSSDRGSAIEKPTAPHRPGAKRCRSDDADPLRGGARTVRRDAVPSPEHVAYLPEAA